MVQVCADQAERDKFGEELGTGYSKAARLYEEGKFDEYWEALQALPIELHLPASPGHQQTCVEFALRDHPEDNTYTLVVLKTNLPSLGTKEARQHCPDANGLIANPRDVMDKPLLDNRDLGKAAHLLLEAAGQGDLSPS
jgi:hypothetical protein